MRIQLPIVLLACICLVVGCGESKVVQQVELAIPQAGVDDDSDRNAVAASVIRLIPGQVTKTEYEASIIDTTKFEQQVWRTEPFDGEIRAMESLRPQEAEAPRIRQVRPNTLTVDGKVGGFQRVHKIASFPGISQSLFTPPDPTLAVGPNHVVEMVNSEIAFLTKTGVVEFQAILGDQGNPGFFEDVGSGGFCVDPRCFYDHHANRFVVMCLEVYFAAGSSFLTIAVSDDDDPNGVWYKYRTDGVYQVGGANNFADYPSFGFDADGYQISGNLIGISDFVFRGVSFRTMDKTPMLDGQPITVNDVVADGFFTTQMAQCFGELATVPYAVTFDTSTTATIIALEDPLNDPTVVTTSVPIPFYDTSGSVTNGGGIISALGGRAMNAHVRDGKLYSCHSVTDGSQELARWYEFDLNGWPSGGSPVLIQSGEIDLGGAQETFFPAIYSNRYGSIALVYGNSSDTELISVKASGRMAGDPLGTMSEMVEFDISGTTASGRFGDYFDIAVDPVDDSTFWVVGETMENFGWDTIINSFVVPTIGDVNCDGVIDLLDVDPFVDFVSSGQFFDKADINRDGNVNLLDVDPFVVLLSGT